MTVFNFNNLLLPSLVIPIITISLKNISPEKAINKEFFDDKKIEKPIERALFFGKCAIQFFKSFSKYFPSIPSFVYSSLPAETFSYQNCVIKFGTHPLPSETNLKISSELKKWIEKTSGDTAVFISGGTSSLLFLPLEGVSFEEIISLERKLILKKIPIKEINYVRMALSELRGGGVGELLKPSNIFGFVWCDVEPKDFKFVGSAPLGGLEIDLKKEAERVLGKYNLKLPFEIKEKKMKKLPANSKIFKLADGIDLCKYVQMRLKRKNIGCKIVNIEEGTSSIEAAKIIFENAEKEKRPSVLVGSGEFLVDVKGSGVGGRCSHLTANIAKLFKKKERWFFGAIATDGVDGNGDGGAFCHSEKKININELDKAIKEFNTGEFFRRRGMVFEKKPTRNNLRDLWFLTME